MKVSIISEIRKKFPHYPEYYSDEEEKERVVAEAQEIKQYLMSENGFQRILGKRRILQKIHILISIAICVLLLLLLILKYPKWQQNSVIPYIKDCYILNVSLAYLLKGLYSIVLSYLITYSIIEIFIAYTYGQARVYEQCQYPILAPDTWEIYYRSQNIDCEKLHRDLQHDTNKKIIWLVIFVLLSILSAILLFIPSKIYPDNGIIEISIITILIIMTVISFWKFKNIYII